MAVPFVDKKNPGDATVPTTSRTHHYAALFVTRVQPPGARDGSPSQDFWSFERWNPLCWVGYPVKSSKLPQHQAAAGHTCVIQRIHLAALP